LEATSPAPTLRLRLPFAIAEPGLALALPVGGGGHDLHAAAGAVHAGDAHLDRVTEAQRGAGALAAQDRAVLVQLPPLSRLHPAAGAGGSSGAGAVLWRATPLRPRAHPRWVGMRVGSGELAVWSFLMATAHGAGLMLFPVLLSAVLTLLWLALVRPARRSNRRAMLNWAAGMSLVWGMYMTIWLPYLDSRRSYRSVAESLANHLPAETCLASHNLGEPQRALLEYFLNVITVRDDSQASNRCKALLLQAARDESDTPPDSAWEKVWEGRRRGDDTERFVLFRRPTAGLRP